MNPQATSIPPRSGRLKFLLLAAMFLAPLIVAQVLYSVGWRSESINRGELVQPARFINDTRFETLTGDALRFSDLRGKWTFIYFSPAECLSACEKNLYKMRQVHESQGRYVGRIQRVFVVTDTTALEMLRYTLKDHPGMQVLVGPRENVSNLAKQFVISAGSPLDKLDRIYVVDPLGNFMMSYPVDADPSAIRKDLGRLLKVSQIG